MNKGILCFLICTTILRIFALGLDEIIEKTIEKYENLISLYAEFEQILCDELTGTCTNFEGKIYFLKPNSFRLEVKNPQQIYVGDSVSLWIYLPAENKARKQSFSQVPFQINPDIFLKDYDKRFSVELTDDGEENYQITLTPIEETDIYKKIIVEINKEKYEINGITIFDEAGSENKFNFSKIEINRKLPKKLFEFTPPKGTQVDEY